VKEAEAEPAQWSLARRTSSPLTTRSRGTFELAHRLLEVEAEAARQRAALEVLTDVALVREYEQWLAEAATRRIKKEIIDLDDE
jgi:hypothetical protein